MSIIYELFGAKIAHADTGPVQAFVGRVNYYITNPLIILMFAAALVFFLYGVFEFVMNADKADERELGKTHIMWGVVGMFVMFSVFALLRLIENTLGIPHNGNVQ